MKNIDFLITHFERYHLLKELLDSIFKYYPEAKVTVADQSKLINDQFYQENKVDLIRLPYDCGLSKARNTLVRQTKRPYKLILEDDFLFTKDTKIGKLERLMNIADIAGGGVYRNKKRKEFEFNFKVKDKIIYQVKDADNWKKYWNIKYKETSCVCNFFLAKAEVFEKCVWKSALKLREHQHFFYRACENNKIIFTDDVKIVDNKRGDHPNYKKLKNRNHFWRIALEDLGVKGVQYLTGRRVTVTNEGITIEKCNS